MNCINCGEEIEEKWVKCPSCGILLKCPYCNEKIKNKNWKECPNCGKAVSLMASTFSRLMPFLILGVSFLFGIIIGLIWDISATSILKSEEFISGDYEMGYAYNQSQWYMIISMLLVSFLLSFYTKSSGLGALTPILHTLGIMIMIPLEAINYTGNIIMFGIMIAVGVILGAILGMRGGKGEDLGKALPKAIDKSLDLSDKSLDVGQKAQDLSQD